ncbi:PGF-CTERM sorting domain-containing protein [Halocatena marina]|uniref:PGF-CTERM sorting domain-containing protein n=1 Tax=Halocatena marina TaxID=2934937 RepID=A0ABD5YUS0_9EURY
MTQSTSTEAATTTASTERTPSAENPTTTDGPGFGVLSTLAAAGVGLWGYRRRE